MMAAESFALGMLAQFESSRLEQMGMLIQSTDVEEYQKFVETKNNPRISQFLKDSNNNLISEEQKSFLEVLSHEPEETKIEVLREINVLNSRKELDGYFISHLASRELQKRLAALYQENINLQKEIELQKSGRK